MSSGCLKRVPWASLTPPNRFLPAAQQGSRFRLDPGLLLRAAILPQAAEPLPSPPLFQPPAAFCNSPARNPGDSLAYCSVRNAPTSLPHPPLALSTRICSLPPRRTFGWVGREGGRMDLVPNPAAKGSQGMEAEGSSISPSPCPHNSWFCGSPERAASPADSSCQQHVGFPSGDKNPGFRRGKQK